jgi:hypothetical protein
MDDAPEPIATSATTQPARGTGAWARLPALAYLALTAVILGVAVALLAGNMGLIAAHGGEDFATYVQHVRNWLAGDGYYPAHQLAGPYQHQNDTSLYPPPFALFMLPWVWLPAVLWWVIPFAVTAYTVVRWRPALWAWPLIALCIAAPRTLSLVIWGNSTMWIVAAVAATLYWRVPATPLIFLKPGLAFFALIGIRSRWWWVTTVAGVVVALVMLPMWPDFIASVRNIRGTDPTHSLFDTAFVLIPLLAYVARRPRTDA